MAEAAARDSKYILGVNIANVFIWWPAHGRQYIGASDAGWSYIFLGILILDICIYFINNIKHSMNNKKNFKRLSWYTPVPSAGSAHPDEDITPSLHHDNKHLDHTQNFTMQQAWNEFYKESRVKIYHHCDI